MSNSSRSSMIFPSSDFFSAKFEKIASEYAIFGSFSLIVIPVFIQVENRAKFYLLECATAEAVLRLDKTLLCDEADEIQAVYLREQNHENLLQYLEATLPNVTESQLLQVRKNYSIFLVFCLRTLLLFKLLLIYSWMLHQTMTMRQGQSFSLFINIWIIVGGPAPNTMFPCEFEVGLVEAVFGSPSKYTSTQTQWKGLVFIWDCKLGNGTQFWAGFHLVNMMSHVHNQLYFCVAGHYICWTHEQQWHSHPKRASSHWNA